ncbi:MAG: hypothetical protein R2860_02250 [Desulfobacterales bacterium]
MRDDLYLAYHEETADAAQQKIWTLQSHQKCSILITEFMHSIEDKRKKRFKYAGETDEHDARPGKYRPPHGKKALQIVLKNFRGKAERILKGSR